MLKTNLFQFTSNKLLVTFFRSPNTLWYGVDEIRLIDAIIYFIYSFFHGRPDLFVLVPKLNIRLACPLSKNTLKRNNYAEFFVAENMLVFVCALPIDRCPSPPDEADRKILLFTDILHEFYHSVDFLEDFKVQRSLTSRKGDIEHAKDVTTFYNEVWWPNDAKSKEENVYTQAPSEIRATEFAFRNLPTFELLYRGFASHEHVPEKFFGDYRVS
jgi:hypothetical protein